MLCLFSMIGAHAWGQVPVLRFRQRQKGQEQQIRKERKGTKSRKKNPKTLIGLLCEKQYLNMWRAVPVACCLWLHLVLISERPHSLLIRVLMNTNTWLCGAVASGRWCCSGMAAGREGGGNQNSKKKSILCLLTFKTRRPTHFDYTAWEYSPLLPCRNNTLSPVAECRSPTATFTRCCIFFFLFVTSVYVSSSRPRQHTRETTRYKPRHCRNFTGRIDIFIYMQLFLLFFLLHLRKAFGFFYSNKYHVSCSVPLPLFVCYRFNYWNA